MITDALAYLRTTLDAATARAEAAGGDEWTAQEHPAETVAIYDSQREPVVYDEGAPSTAQTRHIVANSPATVLHRIAADRKLIALYETARAEYAADGHAYDWESDTGRARTAALEEAVQILAEGWGWAGDTPDSAAS